MLKQESIEQSYATLYMEFPKDFVESKDVLLGAAARLGHQSEGDLFNKHMQELIDAVVSEEKRDFIASNEFHRHMQICLKQGYPLVDIFRILQVTALTNSIIKIEALMEPDEFFERLQLDQHEQTVSFLMYLNNWLCQIVGMRSLRQAPGDYVKFLTKVFDKKDTQLTQFAMRCLFNACRAIPAVQMDENYLGLVVSTFVNAAAMQQDPQGAKIFNMACGVIGRTLITLQAEDAKKWEEFKETVMSMNVQITSDKGLCTK